MGSEFSSNISPLEMAEMNNEDAKQIDIAIGVIVNEMPSKIAYVKNVLDEVSTNIKSLKTRNLSFSINGEMEYLSNDYDKFVQEVLSFASYYELEIINVINIFDRQNSLDGTLTVDNNYLNRLPLLGSLLFTLLSYYGDGNPFNDPTQYTLDAVGAYMDRNDFNACFGNMAYNAGEFVAKRLSHLNNLGRSSLAFGSLIAVESLHDLLFVNTDSRQNKITLVHAYGDGVKLLGGNIIADVAGTYIAPEVATWVGTHLSGIIGTKLAGVAGGAAGGLVGIGMVVLGEFTLDFVVDPLVDAVTGEAFIYGTSIPQNGGLTSLYSDYVAEMSRDPIIYIEGIGKRNTTLYGMTVSAEYFDYLLQQDPVDTIMGRGYYDPRDGNYYYSRRDNPQELEKVQKYLDELRAIPNDCDNFNQKVDDVYKYSGQYSDYVCDIIRWGFDPYSYAINN